MMATRLTPFSIKSSRKQSLDNLDKPSPGQLIAIVSSMKTPYAKESLSIPHSNLLVSVVTIVQKDFFFCRSFISSSCKCFVIFSLLLFRFSFSSGNVALLIRKPPLWWGQLPSQLQGSSSQSEKTERTSVTSQDVVD